MVRRFVGRRGGFAPEDRTSSELVAEVTRRTALVAALRPRLVAWLAVADQVKFAGAEADAAQAQAQLDEARALVRGEPLTEERAGA